MDNPYITYAPQMMTDEQINPMYQNIAGQNALHSQMMLQGQQLGQPTQQQGFSTSNAMSLANALRNMKSRQPNQNLQPVTDWSY